MGRPRKIRPKEDEDDDSSSYNGNANIKADGVVMEYTKEQTEEYIKCAQNIVYFIHTYCKVMTLDRGFTHIELRDYQRRYFDFLEGNRFPIVHWPRQAGKTITVAYMLLFYCIFNNMKNVAIVEDRMPKDIDGVSLAPIGRGAVNELWLEVEKA